MHEVLLSLTCVCGAAPSVPQGTSPSRLRRRSPPRGAFHSWASSWSTVLHRVETASARSARVRPVKAMLLQYRRIALNHPPTADTEPSRTSRRLSRAPGLLPAPRPVDILVGPGRARESSNHDGKTISNHHIVHFTTRPMAAPYCRIGPSRKILARKACGDRRDGQRQQPCDYRDDPLFARRPFQRPSVLRHARRQAGRPHHRSDRWLPAPTDGPRSPGRRPIPADQRGDQTRQSQNRFGSEANTMRLRRGMSARSDTPCPSTSPRQIKDSNHAP